MIALLPQQHSVLAITAYAVTIGVLRLTETPSDLPARITVLFVYACCQVATLFHGVFGTAFAGSALASFHADRMRAVALSCAAYFAVRAETIEPQAATFAFPLPVAVKAAS